MFEVHMYGSNNTLLVKLSARSMADCHNVAKGYMVTNCHAVAASYFRDGLEVGGMNTGFDGNGYC